MSKSKKNIASPEELCDRYGADTARMFSLFAAPPEKDLEWSDTGVEGCYRFLNRVWRLVQDLLPVVNGGVSNPGSRESELLPHLQRATHQTIKKVTEDLERGFQFNTAIAALMEFVNELYKFWKEFPAEGLTAAERAGWRSTVDTLLVLLAPFAPHLAEELWETLGNPPGISRQAWPDFDPVLVASAEWTIPLQVNGKLRSRIAVPAGSTKEQIISVAQDDPKLAEWLQGKAPRKIIYVEQKLVNFVI
jgi:leucyl-tRNA synthetase